jgi:putative glutamine amidotransferase
MARPLVGITTASLAALDGVGGPHPESSVVGRRYVQAVAAAGGVPWPIPIVAEVAVLRALYDRLDGLVLAGGADIRPIRYRGWDHPAMDAGDPERDEVEHFLATWAVHDGKPLLGVCRGMQMLNVSRGGTLVPHLERPASGGIRHDNLPLASCPRDLLAHEVEVLPGSRTAAALRTTTLAVNSIHHQAVDRPGAGLLVAARAPDGVIEAVEDPDHPFCIGVQWHPEELPGHAPCRSLFGALLEACRARAQGVSADPRPLLVAG